MQGSTELLRWLVGLIGIGCAYMLGRAVAAVHKGWRKPSQLTGWILRTVLCLAAVAFQHSLDAADVAVGALVLVAFSAALWNTSREKKEEDVTHTIFPDEH